MTTGAQPVDPGADDGKVLIRCHAGCDQRAGDRRSPVPRPVGMELWSPHGFGGGAAKAQPDRDDAGRTDAALAIWRSTLPAVGTPVETYLVSRGLISRRRRRSASIPG